jgi:hypothetical protein
MDGERKEAPLAHETMRAERYGAVFVRRSTLPKAVAAPHEQHEHWSNR